MNLEVYEYIINGSDRYSSFYTTKLSSVSADTCGYIGSEGDTPYEKSPISDTRPRTCDSIDGTIKYYPPGPALVKQELLIDNADEISFDLSGIKSDDLIRFIHHFLTKMNSKDPDTKTKVMEAMPSMGVLYDVDYVSQLITNATKLMTDQRGTLNQGTHEYIKILRPKIEHKIIIIGDIHGSHATVIRILLRLRKMNVFNNKCLFNENYHLIFLGDLIDRGTYSPEIVMLIYLLKLINPNNIHINNGNHEEKRTNGNDFVNSNSSFKMHLEAIFGYEIGETLFDNFNDLFLLNHSALMIENPNKPGEYCYLAHGGLPFDTTGILSYSPLPIDFHLASEFNEEAFRNETNKIFIPSSKLYMPNTTSSCIIRWLDFYGGPGIDKSDRGGWKIGYNLVEKVEKMGIKLIIRGHQDMKYNTKLLVKGTNDFIDINKVPPHDSGNKKSCYGYTNLIKLSDTGGLNINGIDNKMFMPVITISTNTDLGRDLVRDSFTILKFVEEFNPDIQGCVEEGSEDEDRIKTNLKRLNGRPELRHEEGGEETKDSAEHKQKYLKYKAKYLKLKSKLNH
jgi:hypothetical protein